jgi:hypothetical protein
MGRGNVVGQTCNAAKPPATSIVLFSAVPYAAVPFLDQVETGAGALPAVRPGQMDRSEARN